MNNKKIVVILSLGNWNAYIVIGCSTSSLLRFNDLESDYSVRYHITYYSMFLVRWMKTRAPTWVNSLAWTWTQSKALMLSSFIPRYCWKLHANSEMSNITCNIRCTTHVINILRIADALQHKWPRFVYGSYVWFADRPNYTRANNLVCAE